MSAPAMLTFAGAAASPNAPKPCLVQLRNLERRRWWHRKLPVFGDEEGPVCNLVLPATSQGRQGLQFTLTLPSFSGGTPMVPEVLQYACRLSTRIRPVRPIRVSAPPPAAAASAAADKDALHCILTGRPVIALAFSDMSMTVQAPIPLYDQERGSLAAAAYT